MLIQKCLITYSSKLLAPEQVHQEIIASHIRL